MGIAIPFLLLLLFGFALTLDVDRVPLAVRDESDTPRSRELISRFRGSRYFSTVPGGGYASIERAIDEGRVLAGLIVPRDFDVSPYFEVVKPALIGNFDFRSLRWSDATAPSPAWPWNCARPAAI